MFLLFLLFSLQLYQDLLHAQQQFHLLLTTFALNSKFDSIQKISYTRAKLLQIYNDQDIRQLTFFYSYKSFFDYLIHYNIVFSFHQIADQLPQLNDSYMKILQSHSKLIQIQNRLSKQSYLSRSSLPGHSDAKMFLYLESNKKYPDRKAYPHLYHWYILMKQFALSSVQTWLKKGEYHEEDGLITDFINIKTNQKILTSILENKKEKTQEISPEQLKLHRSDDLSNQQIEYIMDIKLKQNETKTPKQFATAFLIDQQQNIHQERIQVQELTVFNEERRIRLIAKMNSQKFQTFKNKISHLEGVETFQSKKKQKKFKTVNSQNNVTFVQGIKQAKE